MPIKMAAPSTLHVGRIQFESAHLIRKYAIMIIAIVSMWLKAISSCLKNSISMISAICVRISQIQLAIAVIFKIRV